MSGRSENGGEFWSNDPILILRSHNRKFPPWELGPTGEYQVGGILRRSYLYQAIDLVDSDEIRRKVSGWDDAQEPNRPEYSPGREPVPGTMRQILTEVKHHSEEPISYVCRNAIRHLYAFGDYARVHPSLRR
jgi:hypothetical protein